MPTREQWGEIVSGIVSRGGDAVDVAREVARISLSDRADQFVAAAAFRDAYGLRITQTIEFLRWLEGNLSDDELRALVPIGPQTQA